MNLCDFGDRSVELRFFTRPQLEKAKKELLAWNPLLKIETLGENMDTGTCLWR